MSEMSEPVHPLDRPENMHCDRCSTAWGIVEVDELFYRCGGCLRDDRAELLAACRAVVEWGENTCRTRDDMQIVLKHARDAIAKAEAT